MISFFTILKAGKIDVTNGKALAGRFNVDAIPAIFFYNDKKVAIEVSILLFHHY